MGNLFILKVKKLKNCQKLLLDNAAVVVNIKGEMKGSIINGPIARECAELWPRVAAKASSVV
jgi:ribosomal protein L14